MKINLLFAFLLLLLVLGTARGQQSSVRELDTFDQLRSQVQDLNRTRYIKGRFSPGDGGGGLFVFTNTIIATNTGTRLQVAGKNYSWERMHDGVVNVKWFGAIGDPNNITDDTAAIQACENYCYTNDFTRFIPDGTFGVASTLVVHERARWKGNGAQSVLYGLATTHTMTLSSRTNVWLRSFAFGGSSEGPLYINGSSRCTFDDLIISGATINFGVQVTAGIHIEGCFDLTFNNPIFDGNGLGPGHDSVFDYNFMGGTDGLSSTNILINHPIVRNNHAKYGIVWYRQHSATTVAPNVDMGLQGSTNNISGYGLVSYGRIGEFNEDINWVSPTVFNAYGSGIYYNLTRGGSVTAPALRDVAQSQTTAASLLPAGISVNNSLNIRISAVGITNSGISSGVAFSQTTNCAVIGGTIEGVGTNKYGVQFSGNNFGPVVKGIQFSATLSARRAIAMDTGNVVVGADIEGNTIDGWYDGIILLVGCTNNIVRGNRIYNNVNTGIQDFGSYNTIDDNILTGGGVGIFAGGDNGLLGLNTVVGHSTGLLLNGTGYRVNTAGRYHDNAIPISDAGGNIINTITSGTTPSVKNSPVYYLQYAAPTSITDFTDGLPGMRRTFFVANTNVTIVHGTPIVLDGNNNFNMKLGDSLTLERHPSGVWIQVGKNINSSYVQYDRGAEILKINAPLQDFNTTVQVTAPSASVYPEDHALTTNTTASALIARWIALGNQNAFVIKQSADKTNYVFTYDGVDYQFPKTNGVSGQVLASDGTTPQHLYWTNTTGGGSSYIFDPTQFSSAGGLVAITNGAPVTNLFFKGQSHTVVLDVSGVNVDAGTGTEFSKTLASNTTLGIINMTNGQSVSVTITNTTFTLGWTNVIAWISGQTPTLDTNAVNVFHFFKTGDRILGSDPEQVANANLVGLATISGTGVVVKTNSTAFATFNPLPVRYGGTGTNAFTASVLSGNIVFWNNAAQSLDADDGALQWIKSVGTLGIARAVPTGQPQIILVEAGGVVPLMQIYANRIQEANDDLYLEALTGGHSIFGQITGTNGFELTPDYSFVAGGGSTVTTRTNHFFYLPTSAGPPTGTPVTETGHVAMDYDTVAKHLYVYQGGWNQIDGAGTLSFSGSVGGVVYSPDGSSITNGTNFIVLSGGQKIEMFSDSFLYPVQLFDNTTGNFLALKGEDILFGTASGTSTPAITVQRNAAQQPLWLRIEGESPLLTVSTNRSIVLGNGSTATGRTTNFLFIPTFAGVPSGVPPTETGTVPIGFDTSNTNLYVYASGAWRIITGTGGGGGDNDNITAVSGSTTNDFLNGDLFVDKVFSTNGVAVGSTLLTLNSLAMPNNGGAATIANSSSSRLSHLDLKGGNGAESFIQFYSSNTIAGTFDTNRIFNAFYGTRSDNTVVSNLLTIPTAAVPSTTAFGQIAGDNNAWAASRGAVQWYDGTANTYLVGTLASDTPANGQVPTWNTGGTITWETPAALSGAVWTNDNQVIKPDTSTGISNKLWLADSLPYVVRIDTGGAWPVTDNDHLLEINNFQTNVLTVAPEGGLMVGRNTRNFWTSIADNGEALVSVAVTSGQTVNDVNFKQIYIGATNAGNMGWVDMETTTNSSFVKLGVNTTSSVTLDGATSTVTANKLSGPPAEVTRLHVESAKLPLSNPARISNVSDYIWELLFDASTSQSAGWSFIMPQTYGSSLTARFKTTVKGVQTGTKNVIYRFYVAAMKATENPTSPTFSSANSVTVALANNQAADNIVESTVTLTNADSVSAGDLVIIKVDRDAANGSDTATGDSALVGAIAVEWSRAQ